MIITPNIQVGLVSPSLLNIIRAKNIPYYISPGKYTEIADAAQVIYIYEEKIQLDKRMKIKDSYLPNDKSITDFLEKNGISYQQTEDGLILASAKGHEGNILTSLENRYADHILELVDDKEIIVIRWLVAYNGLNIEPKKIAAYELTNKNDVAAEMLSYRESETVHSNAGVGLLVDVNQTELVFYYSEDSFTFKGEGESELKSSRIVDYSTTNWKEAYIKNLIKSDTKSELTLRKPKYSAIVVDAPINSQIRFKIKINSFACKSRYPGKRTFDYLPFFFIYF